MDQATIQARINHGLAKAAAIVGADFAQYRPTGAFDPLLTGSSMAMLPCAIDRTAALSLDGPVPPGHPFAVLLADPGKVQFGDYLVGPDTYFVSRIQPLQAAWCVLCNVTLDVMDTAQATLAGTNTYGGVTNGTNTLVAQAWPMSMLAKTRGEQDVTKLPSDTRSAFYEVLLPNIPGITLGIGLCLQDINGQMYEIMNTEESEYGVKLLVGVATT